MATPEEEGAQTTLHVRRAREGDLTSLGWLAERLQPLLLAQARYRLGSLRAIEPEDLVAEAWCVALPRLAELAPREGRVTPVVLRFLSTTLLRLANNHVRREVRRGGRAEAGRSPETLSAEGRRVLSEVEGRERARALRDELAALTGLTDKADQL